MLAQASRAAVLTAYKEPLQVREYPVPAELSPGECLVRVEMAGICGTDVHLWLGQLPIPLPVILGHETVGRIEQLGAGPNKDWRGMPLSIGDRVTWASSIGADLVVECAGYPATVPEGMELCRDGGT